MRSAAKQAKKASKEYREPTESEKRLIYTIYELLYSSHFTLPKKRTMMTAALGYETWSWRVVGITEEAIKAIARNGFNKPSRMLARDHSRPRAETYTKIFAEEKMPFQVWWDWVWEHDQTVLMTNEEHHDPTKRSRTYPINPAESYFVDGEVAGWYQTKAREGALVQSMVEKYSIAY